jgi:ABC-type phosphate/phosphonate transport system substrate-binding protein
MLLTLLAALASPPEPLPALRVATYSYPRYDRRIALEPLAQTVARVSGRQAEIILLDTPDALAKAMCDGSVDVAMTNLGAFVAMRDCSQVEAVAVLDTPEAVLERYRGVLLVRGDAGLETLSELKAAAGRLRYSEVLPGSTSGALVQADALRTVGVRASDFAARRHAGTHDAAMLDLLDGRADIAAFAEEPWRKLQVEAPGRAAMLRPLWRSGPLPPGPLVCRTSAAVDCKALGAALLGAAGEALAGPLSEGWTETAGALRFRAFEADRYDAFKPG